MKFGFQFSNLCGTVYQGGTILFNSDGSKLISPVGNRISVFDLERNESYTLPWQNQNNIVTLALSPNDRLLVTIDKLGKGIVSDFKSRTLLTHFRFGGGSISAKRKRERGDKVKTIKFSPNGKFIAVGVGKRIVLYKVPRILSHDFTPFTILKTFAGLYDDVTSLCWSSDSEYILAGSKDLSARIYSVTTRPQYIPPTLSGHKQAIIECFFSDDDTQCYCISRDGAIFVWMREDSEDKTNSDYIWTLSLKYYFDHQNALVSSVAFHSESSLLIIGFSSGVFGLYQIDNNLDKTKVDIHNIHTLSITAANVTATCVNTNGNWIAFGSAALGQLVVWEWKSESYILKQQGHSQDMKCLAYSKEGEYIATGGDDAKVKVWNVLNSFCFVTFSEHSATVSAVEWSSRGSVLFSSSYDGTVRAYDMIRYRNFRTFTSPTPVQFTCLAIDPSGEIVVAGAKDPFEIYAWNVQTGQLIDILTGHEGPISSLHFSPIDSVLISGSWDKTVKIWDIFVRKSAIETLETQSDILSVCWRPDGKEFCASTLGGHIRFWDSDAKEIGSIDGKRDIIIGRKKHERIASNNNSRSKYFTKVTYTLDGNCVLACGNSNYICLYECSQRVLLKRFKLSNNKSLDGVLEFLNSKKLGDAGIEYSSSDEDEELDRKLNVQNQKRKRLMNGAVGTEELITRRTQKSIVAYGIEFSPTSRAWSCVTTEGLVIFSLEDSNNFDPIDLGIDITVSSVNTAIEFKEWLKALLIALRLNDKDLISNVFKKIPPNSISSVVGELPQEVLFRVINLVATQVEETPHIEYCLKWTREILQIHGIFLQSKGLQMKSAFRNIHKAINKKYKSLSTICDENRYIVDYLVKASSIQQS